MADLLKHIYSRAFIENFAQLLEKREAGFQTRTFVEELFSNPWDELELKDRMRHIACKLHQHLPYDFPENIGLLMDITSAIQPGFGYMFLPEYVSLYGRNHWELSMKALAHFTRFASAEFAIRTFLKMNSKKGLQQMTLWSKSTEEDLQRLASEGCRPRLPWGEYLREFQENPAPLWPILEQLKSNPSLYVRRSVANNLNDISKDHPEIAKKKAKEWWGQNPLSDWVVKHAMRGLLKKADPEVMALFGYSPPDQIHLNYWHHTPRVAKGKIFFFEFEIFNLSPSPVKLRVEYLIHYLKANGAHSAKVFHISEKSYSPGAHRFQRKQSFKDISTRKHYPGLQLVSLRINGSVMKQAAFELGNR